jgi:flagellin-like hook-associated protein FlgL
VQNAIQELATGRRIADPADQVVANRLLADSNLCMSIGNGLGNDRTITVVASAATNQIQDTLISLKEAVIASTGENPNTNFARQKIAGLLTTIDDNVNDATVNGVNLISGCVGGAVTTTAASSVADPAGGTISVGGSGPSAMRATMVGLGLANFTADGPGMNLTFSVQPPQFLLGGNYPLSITFVNQGLGTAQFPTETRTFQSLFESLFG